MAIRVNFVLAKQKIHQNILKVINIVLEKCEQLKSGKNYFNNEKSWNTKH